MNKRFIILAVACVAATAGYSVATAKEARGKISVAATLRTVVDRAVFKDVVGSISNIRGARLAGTLQSADSQAAPVRIWHIPAGIDADAAVRKALRPFETEINAELADTVKPGVTFPVQFFEKREYVEGIETSSGKSGVVTGKPRMATADAGLWVKFTPTVESDHIKVGYVHELSKFTGPDDGFKNLKVGKDTIQLRQIAERNLSTSIDMPTDGGKVVVVAEGVENNEYVVTVLSAKAVR